MAVHNGTAYYIKSITQKDADASAESVAASMTSVMNMLMEGDNNFKVIAVACDNAPVNPATYRLLTHSYDWLIHIPCTAHTIQIVVNKGLFKTAQIEPIIIQIHSITSQFLASKTARQALLKLAINEKKMTKNKILRIVPTRWSATLIACQRILYLFDEIAYVMKKENMSDQIGDAFKHQLTSLIPILKPFKNATDMIQSDKVTLIAVHKANQYMKSEMKKLTEEKHVFTRAIEKTMEKLDEQWACNTNEYATRAVVYLSAIDGAVAEPDVMEWIIKLGAKYILAFNLSEHDNIDAIEADIQSQLNMFNTRTAPFDTSDTVMKRTKGDPREYWNFYLGTKYALVNFAIALLSICPTEASAERSFSVQDMIHRPYRNRMLEELIEAEMMIKFNTKRQQQQKGTYDSDMESDVDEVDENEQYD